jgi:hypothetical protein
MGGARHKRSNGRHIEQSDARLSKIAHFRRPTGFIPYAGFINLTRDYR